MANSAVVLCTPSTFRCHWISLSPTHMYHDLTCFAPRKMLTLLNSGRKWLKCTLYLFDRTCTNYDEMEATLEQSGQSIGCPLAASCDSQVSQEEHVTTSNKLCLRLNNKFRMHGFRIRCCCTGKSTQTPHSKAKP